MSDSWFEYAIAPDGIQEDGCRPEEAQALRAYLRDEITVIEAAKEIVRPTEECENPLEDLPNLWGVLQDALIQLPNLQSKIVELICSIKQRPDSGSVKSSSTRFWLNLPSFGHQWYDGNWWYYQNHWRNHPDTYRSPEKLAQIANIARTEALFVMVDADVLGEGLKFEDLARICDTLEDSKALLDIELPTVQEWLSHAGPILYDLSRTPHEHYLLRSCKDFRRQVKEGKIHAVKQNERDLWQGEGGTSIERWKFWRERLQHLQNDSNLLGSTRETAKIALDAMG